MAQKIRNSLSNNSETLYNDQQQMSTRFGVGVGKTTDKCRNTTTKSKLMRDTTPASAKGSCVINCPVRGARETGSKGDSLVRKEIYADNGASVEVTVKTHKQPKQQQQQKMKNNGGSNSQVSIHTDSWGRILKAQSSNENLCGFNKFDPLRTIHFLGKELHSQLKKCVPHDSNVFDVLSEMQNAIKRVPQDIQVIADAANRKHEYDMKPMRLPSAQVNKVGDKASSDVRSESCQTPNMWYLEPVRLQQHLEESSEKIEKACQQMELLCSKLKSEKECLELQLNGEKDNAKLLSKQIEQYKSKFENANILVDSLQLKNEELSLEVQKQEIQLTAQTCPSAVELSSFIQQLQKQKADTDDENAKLKQQLHIAHIESEKYEAILQARDVQVKEIRYEMTQLQEVVNEQLFDFQNITSSEDMTHSPPTQCNPGDDKTAPPGCWKDSPKKITIENADGTTLDSSIDSEPVQELFNNNLDQYEHAQSVDSSHFSTATATDAEAEDHVSDLNTAAMNFVKKRHVFKIPLVNLNESTNLREKFTELKNQAFSCNGEPCSKSTNCSIE